MVDAAATLVKRGGESVREYALRVAACQDPDVLAVAGDAAIDDKIDEEGELLRNRLPAHKEARRSNWPNQVSTSRRAHAHAGGLTMPPQATTSCGRPEVRFVRFRRSGNSRRALEHGGRLPRSVSRPSSSLAARRTGRRERA